MVETSSSLFNPLGVRESNLKIQNGSLEQSFLNFSPSRSSHDKDSMNTRFRSLGSLWWCLVKCLATLYLGEPFSILLLCSPKHAFSILTVLPTWCCEQGLSLKLVCCWLYSLWRLYNKYALCYGVASGFFFLNYCTVSLPSHFLHKSSVGEHEEDLWVKVLDCRTCSACPFEEHLFRAAVYTLIRGTHQKKLGAKSRKAYPCLEAKEFLFLLGPNLSPSLVHCPPANPGLTSQPNYLQHEGVPSLKVGGICLFLQTLG